MIGLGEVGAGRREARALLLNHTSFYDIATSTVAGVEVNIRVCRERSTLIMPQVQQDIGQRFSFRRPRRRTTLR